MEELHTHSKKIINRLARIEGHVRAIKAMVQECRDCPEVLVQIAAVRKALDNTAKEILKEHLEECVGKSIVAGKQDEALKDLRLAIDRYLS